MFSLASLVILTLFAVGHVQVLAFDNTCNSNLATYWGQNSYGASNPNDPANFQKRLSFYCGDATTDGKSSPLVCNRLSSLFPIAFLNVFFGPGGEPEINLANICNTQDNATFPGTELANCQALSSDIQTCQAAGKLVTISLGGATGGGTFANDTQAASFADQIWNLFLGGASSTRPFGAAVLDGVDLDIEGGTQSFVPFVNQLRTHMNAASKTYYITAAPQCPYPDSALGATLNAVSFDAVYVQFYNNPCGLTHYSDSSYDWNFGVWDYWARYVSTNKNVKVYIGAPASSGAAGSGYVPIATLQTIAQQTAKDYPSFGGVMLWDVSQAYVNGRFDQAIKSTLSAGKSCGNAFTYQACTAPAFSSTANYPSGSTVSYGGYQWYARWYASGAPVGSDDSNAWRALFACSGSNPTSTTTTTTTSKTSTSSSTSKVSSTTTSTTTSKTSSTTTTSTTKSTTTTTTSSTASGSSCNGVAAWNSSTAYTGGMQVTYNGQLWQAKWWSEADVPGGSAGDWALVGTCVSKRSLHDGSLPRETGYLERRSFRFDRN
ncbi:Chitinase 1 [Tulasnella sp. 330]|nr:Chitinase 1 [Tulasnella sp. 330]KAG8870752.1 Chitinase 1 [Tulasnella sp. 331]